MEKSPYFVGNLCYDPLSKQENIDALTLLLKIVKSCIGPRGKLKLIRNASGGYTTVTSTSSRLFQSLSVKNHFNKMVLSSVKSHLRTYKDGGLLCALFPLTLIQHSSLCDIPSFLKAKLYEYFVETHIACLNSVENHCVWKLDPSNFQHLQAVTQTIISSKLECLLSTSQRNQLCALLLELFLNIFPSSHLNFRFLTLEGRNMSESRLLNMLLVRVPKTDWMLFHPPHPHMKVALFTSPLSSDEHGSLKQLEGKLVSAKVDIVFCQKVVDPSVKKHLNDEGISVFDQLGTETATFLQYLLDDCVNVTLHNVDDLCFNSIKCIKEEIGKKHYILLQKEEHNFCTVILCHSNQEFLSEMKVVCEQVIATLFRLLQNPKVCFGAGCTDIFTALLLTQKIKKESRDIAAGFQCTDDKILSTLSYFLLSLTSTAISSHQDSPLVFKIDTKYWHLWKMDDESNSPSKTCCCGHCRISDSESLSWYSLSDLIQIPESVLCDKPSFEEPRIIDELSSKLNAITMGGEVALSLLKTHLCIFTGTHAFS